MAHTRTQTMVQLNEGLVALLDAEARRRGVSRSALIRETLSEALGASREAALDEAIVRGYERNPPAADAWGDLDASGEQAAVETMQRLDTEEQGPW